MKKTFLIIIFIISYIIVSAQTLNWAKQIGGTGVDKGSSVAIDSIGNVYTVGYFNGTADFDPGVSDYNLTASALNQLFISKLDSNGNFVWAKSIIGTISSDVTKIAVDKNNNIFITGRFSGTVDFNPNEGEYNVTSYSNIDFFVLKLDLNGDFLWVKNFNSYIGKDTDPCFPIKFDRNENIIISGGFKSSTDFDPSSGVYTLTPKYFGLFILKLDKNGNFIWAKKIDTEEQAYISAIVVDSLNNIYSTGIITHITDFDPGVAVYNLSGGKTFILKLDSIGNFVWAKMFGALSSSNDICIDNFSNLYLTGEFRGVVDFDPSTNVYNLNANQFDNEVFIAKLNSNGDFLWAIKTIADYSYSITVDNNGNIYNTGFFGLSHVDFDPSDNNYILTDPFGNSCIYVSKYDTDGNFVWAKDMPGPQNDFKAFSIISNDRGKLYLAGNFYSAADFDPEYGHCNLEPLSEDVFILKLNQDGKAKVYPHIWNEINKIEETDLIEVRNLGKSVFISENYAIVGVPKKTYNYGDVRDPGEAYIYEKNLSGTWVLKQKIKASDGKKNDQFGNNVSISGKYAIVSCLEKKVYIFERDSFGVWKEKQIISPSEDIENNNFGVSVSIYGDYAVIGAEGSIYSYNPVYGIPGKAFIYIRNSLGLWVKNQILIVTDSIVNFDFGTSVSIFENKLIVGAVYNDDFNNPENEGIGSAYIFEKQNNDIWTQVKKLETSKDILENYFGCSVDIKGNYAIVGARKSDFDENGNAKIYNGSGAAYIFKRNYSGNWEEMQKIVAGDRNDDAFKSFGESVSIFDNYAVIGCPYIHSATAEEIDNTDDQIYFPEKGAAYIFKLDSIKNNWTEEQKIIPSDRDKSSYFGNSVSIYGDDILVGAFMSDNISEDGTNISQSGSAYFFTKKGVRGLIYNDLNQNCIKDENELGIAHRRIIINPGEIIVETNSNGYWYLDTLPNGEFTITPDFSGKWKSKCEIPQKINCNYQNSFVNFPSIGIYNTEPCPNPDISVSMPFIRRCFNNQQIFVSASNQSTATGSLNNAYADIKLDSLLILQNANLTYSKLYDNTYRFQLGNINPGKQVNFTINCEVSCDAKLGDAICINANLNPIENCFLDTISSSFPPYFTQCNSEWDKSSLKVEGKCKNDSIFFTIRNKGEFGIADMQCFSPIRIYIDGELSILDSVKLAGGEIKILSFSADGRTWRLEANQHPNHPGNSHPNATVQSCGNNDNSKISFVNIFPPDDADPIVDIFCGEVSGSYDPNDKKGYPIGVSENHYILPDNELEYLIRFQNTGSDTAFTVIIRDTLDTNLDVFSVVSGSSSHKYKFEIYGSRILQWTFNNIMLPDSFSNVLGSNGFISFKVKQINNLLDSTKIKNKASIYFDYNDPIITNTTNHTINRNLILPSWKKEKNISIEACSNYNYNGIIYNKTGKFWQIVKGENNVDTLVKIDFKTLNSFKTIDVSVCDKYMAPNNEVFYTPGIKTVIIPNHFGCDSILTINLKIEATFSSFPVTSCDNYVAPDGIIYNTSGIIKAIIPNHSGCDSTITINLTIKSSSQSSINETACDIYTAPDGLLYINSGIKKATINNHIGCDSVITINLKINEATFSNLYDSAYQYYNAPDGLIYTTSGLKTFVIPNKMGCDSTINMNLTVINSFKNVVKIYPNPTYGFFKINFGFNIDYLELNITDVFGKSIQNGVYKDEQLINIKLDNASGIYFVTLTSKYESYTFKIVKY